MLGNVNGSINIVNIKIFSIPSQTAAIMPKIDIIYACNLNIQIDEKQYKAIILDGKYIYKNLKKYLKKPRD